jgi:hypothetical protein
LLSDREDPVVELNPQKLAFYQDFGWDLSEERSPPKDLHTLRLVAFARAIKYNAIYPRK